MPTLERTAERRTFEAPTRRVSWGAIFGGATLAVAIMIVLGTLGVAIGATTADPGPGGTPSATSFGIGAGIWWLVSGLIAMFAGGWAAGRLAGLQRKLEGPLHGLVTWALTVLASTVLMTSVIGMLISGAFRVVGTTAQVAASGSSGDIAGQLGEMADKGSVAQVQSEARELVGKTEAGPGAEAEIDSAIQQLERSAGQPGAQADEKAVVDILVDRADMSEAEAQKTVYGWSKQLESPAGAASAAGGDVQQQATDAASAAVSAIAGAAWWTFIYLLLTAAAAGLGGFVGAPKTRHDRERRPRREARAEGETV